MAECEELLSEARNICLIAIKSEAVNPEYLSVVSEVSIENGPFAGQKTNRIKLGPFVKPEFVKELLPSLPSLGGYPDTPSLPPFIYSPHELHCPWTKSTTKPLSGWTTCHDTLDWFNRLSSRHEKWKSQRIYEFLKLSTYPSFPFDGVLAASLLSCWNPCLNVFITGQGPMTVTLEDIAYITGLSPSGIDLPYHTHVEGALDVTNILFRNAYNKVVPNLSFSSFMNKYKGNTNQEVTREEEILFINFSLCKMLMGPSINVHRTFLLLAANIEASPADKPLALGPFLLAQFYRCMYKLRTLSSLVHAGGPVWLLTFWGFLYFPSLVSIKSPEEMDEAITNDTCMSPSSACCYGEVATLLLSVRSRKAAADILPKLLDSEPPLGSKNVNWHPCSAKDEMDGPLDCFSSWAKFSVPLWLRETSPIMYKSEDSAHWQSILAQRDLLYVGPQTIGVEVYNPNLVARQFGMIQACAIPLYQTQNRPWGSRLEFLVGHKKFNQEEELERKYGIEKNLTSSHTFKITDFNVQPWFCSADVDDGFDIWWKDFWKRHEEAETFITNQQIIIKALDEYKFKTNTLDPALSHIGPQRETETAKDPSPQMGTRSNIKDSIPFSVRSPRTKKRISASAAQILKLKVDPNTETVNENVAEEEVDDSILLRKLKRRKTKGINSPTPMSPGSSTDHASDAPFMDVLPSSNGTVCVIGLQANNTGKRGQTAKSRENIEVNEEPPVLPLTVEAPTQCAYPISRSSILPETTTTEALMAESIENTPLNGPNSINLSEPCNQQEDVEAPDSVKVYGKITARMDHLLKALSHPPLPSISLLESKKVSLLDTLGRLVNDPENFDSFTELMGLAQEFTELAPAFQSTMDHLKKSIRSIQELSFKLKNQGPQILLSLKKKPELTASMEQLRHEAEKKVEGVRTLRENHVNICRRIEILEAELMPLKRQRDVVGEQLADADNELASLSHQLEESVTALEKEAEQLARAESMRTSWDQDMKVFRSAIVGVIEQLRSL